MDPELQNVFQAALDNELVIACGFLLDLLFIAFGGGAIKKMVGGAK